jgi:hypothetical protein
MHLFIEILWITSISLWLAAFCWTKSLLCNVVIWSGQPSHASGHPSTVQACIHPDVSVTCPDALQSFRRIQRSSVSVQTTWQYRSDSIQCSSKMISFADTDMGRQLQLSGRQVYTVRTLSLIRQDVEKNCNRSDVRATPFERQSLLWKLRAAEVQPSARGLIQERISAFFEKPVAQLSVRTTLACFRTPPRENRIIVDLGLLHPINRGF